MTGEQYLRAVRDHWRVIIAATLVGLLLAVGALFLVPKKYAASADAFVLPSGAAQDATAAYQGGLLSEQRVKSYVQLFQGGRVSDLVIPRLGLPLTSEELTKKITVSAQTDSVIMTITVVDSSPEGAARIGDAAADSFRQLVAQLEQPPDPRLPPATSIKIVAPARVAASPVSPEPTFYLPAGALLGLLVGLAVAVRLNARGRPIRTAEELVAELGVPGLGVVLEREHGGDRSLAALDRTSADAEAFREIRTGLQFADVDHAHKVVLVSSANEGEGKTTLTCNLAAVLAAAGHRVLVIDADLRRPGATQLLGLEQSVGVTTVLRGQAVMATVVQEHAAGFGVLATGPLPPNPSELAASEAMNTLFLTARERYEYVLVDTAPLLPVTDTATLAGLADGVILVCHAGVTLDAEVREAATTLEKVRGALWGSVLTFAPRRGTGTRRYRSYGVYGTGGAVEPGSGPMALPTPHRRAPGSGHRAHASGAGRPSTTADREDAPTAITRRPGARPDTDPTWRRS